MNEIIINGNKFTSKKEVLEALNAIPNAPKKSVGELKPGDKFIYGGIEWVKLDDAYGGVLILAVSKQADMVFNDNEDGDNNWEASSLRKTLNNVDDGHFTTPFLKDVIKDDLIEFERDLTTDDGVKDYGTCKDFISFYTFYEYRKYRKIIPEIRYDHWSITADSLHFKNYACLITYYQVPGVGGIAQDVGVRPLCVLKSDVAVETEENSKDYTFKKEVLRVLDTIPDDPVILSVKDLNPGDRFVYGGIKWVKLDDAYDGALVLAVHEQEPFLFNENHTNNKENNWAESSLRRNLNKTNKNGHFTNTFLKDVDKNDLIEFERDLTTDDGITDYGTCKDFISLYTCDEYRKYRKIIPECKEAHWTITAYDFANRVRYVGKYGSLGSDSVSITKLYFRPLCVLKPDVKVEVKEND